MSREHYLGSQRGPLFQSDPDYPKVITPDELEQEQGPVQPETEPPPPQPSVPSPIGG